MNNRGTSVIRLILSLLLSILSVQVVAQLDTDFDMIWGGDQDSILFIGDPETATAEVSYWWYTGDENAVVDVVVPNYVTNGTYLYEVTSIGEYSFASYNFSSIGLPKNLLYIKDYGFFGIELKPKNEKEFGCIVFPKNLNYIGKGAFEEAGINYDVYDPDGNLVDDGDDIDDNDECDLSGYTYIPASQDIKAYKFQGNAPIFMGTNVFACGLGLESDQYYSTGGSALVFKKEYIDTYTNDFDSAGLWHGLLGNPKLVITAISNDVAKGELTLAWTPSNVYEEVVHPLILDGRKFSVWRSSEDPRIAYDDFSSASNIAQHVTTTNYVDKTFGDFRGTKPVMYWIEFEDVGEEVEQEEPTGMRRHPILEPSSCVTRRRFGLAVGVGDFADPLLPSMGAPKNEALLFAKLMREIPSVMDAANDVTVLINEQATKQGIGTAWRAFTDGNRLHPGDVMIFYVASHGGIKDSGDYKFYTYDGEYSSTELWADMAEFKTRHSGVILIIVVEADNRCMFHSSAAA